MAAVVVSAPLQILVRERGGDDVLFQSNLAPHLSLVHLKEVNADGEAAKEESVETLRERVSILEEENQRLIGIIKDKNKIINDMFNREVELNEAAEQRSAAAAGTTKKGGGKVSSLLLATTPASRNTVKAKADKDQPATKLNGAVADEDRLVGRLDEGGI
ncbi:uncharacterized protein ACA1_382120 [Acanthamoeba castellanii str. Neff]|uniref:Uncharacterized protein n=1 Tax=Acanthamoeba castellanii (strain ATCC 30010 / Neff) TaxID=1257118 RepID=L8GU92_ACACF|nr:uncharacterized protein ACA1_382120 [Acanthamoeba castellanii str. Neff]ELR16754.1 hypothetical protein ACA1_382120 [Acanthamoeba castellanii str. Neff]